MRIYYTLLSLLSSAAIPTAFAVPLTENSGYTSALEARVDHFHWNVTLYADEDCKGKKILNKHGNTVDNNGTTLEHNWKSADIVLDKGWEASFENAKCGDDTEFPPVSYPFAHGCRSYDFIMSHLPKDTELGCLKAIYNT